MFVYTNYVTFNVETFLTELLTILMLGMAQGWHQGRGQGYARAG